MLQGPNGWEVRKVYHGSEFAGYIVTKDGKRPEGFSSGFCFNEDELVAMMGNDALRLKEVPDEPLHPVESGLPGRHAKVEAERDPNLLRRVLRGLKRKE